MAFAPAGLYHLPALSSLPRAGFFETRGAFNKKTALAGRFFTDRSSLESTPFWKSVILAAEDVPPAGTTVGVVVSPEDVLPRRNAIEVGKPAKNVVSGCDIVRGLPLGDGAHEENDKTGDQGAKHTCGNPFA